MDKKFNIAGIGELLWDVFPDYKRFGGAPINFAFHCGALGANAFPVSCVGIDAFGKQILKDLGELGMNTEYIFESSDYPTSTVDVVLNAGKPTYTIHENVAWDHIPCPKELKDLAGKLDAVGFGSLSQRFDDTRATVCSFLKSVSADALKIFDINLRQSFYSKQVVEESLELANVLKLSDEELPLLAKYFDLGGDINEQLAQLRDRFDLKYVAYTRGPDGSVLLSKDEIDDFSGLEGKAIDSVGAGDSYTAAMCTGLLLGWSLKEVNLFASEVSTFVCMQKGATPELPKELVAKVAY